MALSAGLVVALASACGGKPKDDAPDPATTTPTEVARIPVRTSHLTPASFSDRVQVYGRVEPRKDVRILVELQGRVEALPFSEGQRVRKGQTLARINARVMEAQLAQAQANHDLQVAEAARLARMVEKKLATEQQLLVAQAQKAQAEAALELARANLEKAVVASPISGLVTGVTAEVGEVAGPGMPLLEVVDVDEVDVVVDIPERDVAWLKTGAEVSVFLEAFPGEPFPGRVHEIGLVANRVTRTFPMKVRIDNQEGRLRPGMLASLTFERRRYDDVLVAPRDAIIDEVDGKSAYVVEGGVARRRAVELGPTRGRFAVVRTGLEPGEELIVLGHRQVVDGQAVDVTSSEPCCAAQMEGRSPPALAESGATLPATPATAPSP